MTALIAKSPTCLGALLAAACIGLVVTGCGSSPSPSGKVPERSGTADVAYASSLQYLNEKVAGPAFEKAEGYRYSGFGASSGELDTDIAGGEIHPDVLESVGADNITPLYPRFTSWNIRYAGTSIVVAYNPKSRYAGQFKAYASGREPLQDLFTLMERPGFRLGRTDPNIDPQGRDFIFMLELAQAHYNLPSDTVTRILGGPPGSSTSSQIYAESSLDSTLQSGQLDAASAFVTQAVELHMPYIELPPAINLGSFADAAQYATATVTITVKGASVTRRGSPQVIDITTIGTPTKAGVAFIRYTLSKEGLAQYRRGGFTVLTPTASGDTGAIPAPIRSALGT